jgi:hypothetical protein
MVNSKLTKTSAISGHLIYWVLSAVQGLPQSTQWSENQELRGYQPPNLAILLLELNRPVWRYCLFHLAGWGNPQKFVTPSGQTFQQSFSVMNICLCSDSLMFTMQLTMLYGFYYSLILKEVSFWQWKYYRRCSKCNSFWMLSWFSGQAIAGVGWCSLVSTQPRYLDRWDQDPVDALGPCEGLGGLWFLDSWT